MDASQPRKKLSAHELQAQAISKLLAHPDKEVKIPEAPAQRSIRAPRDVMKNVSGSSAGAGSGEFHVYKQQRRREYERIQLMEEQAQKQAEQDEFDRKRAALDQQAESKTDKNRAKREKKRLAALKAKAAASGKPVAETPPADPSKRQRLHNDEVGRVQFKKRTDGDDAADEPEYTAPAAP